MTWTNAQPGAIMTNNMDGSPKKTPTIWLPKDRRLFIPDTAQEHGRPVIVLQGQDPDDTFALILLRNQIKGRYKGREKVMVTF